MADEEKLTALQVLSAILEPLNHGFAAAEREALKQGVQAHMMIGMLLNHMASICAMVEPPGVREELIKDMVRQFAGMVHKHVQARNTSPGGVIFPKSDSP